MADLCRTCALRAHRSAAPVVRRQVQVQVQSRAFSLTQAPRKNVAVPEFAETSSPELDDALGQLRTKHFIPGYLNKRQRHLIFGDKFKQDLENSPAYATLGDEEVPLIHINRRKDIPSRQTLVQKALNMMQTADDFRQIPSLLEGLQKVRTTPNHALQEKVIRKAIQHDQFAVVVRCLRRASQTGMTLNHSPTLNQVLWALRQTASKEDWEEARLGKSLKYAYDIAELLESEEHGTGRRLQNDDPRTRPVTIGQFLELNAVRAYKYNDAKDIDGNVRAFSQRLLSCFTEANEPVESPLPNVGPPIEFHARLPIWHGLTLARAILGNDMPQAQRASEIIQKYESRLTSMAEVLESKNPAPVTYAGLALNAWKACIRP